MLYTVLKAYLILSYLYYIFKDAFAQKCPQKHKWMLGLYTDFCIRSEKVNNKLATLTSQTPCSVSYDHVRG